MSLNVRWSVGLWRYPERWSVAGSLGSLLGPQGASTMLQLPGPQRRESSVEQLACGILNTMTCTGLHDSYRVA